MADPQDPTSSAGGKRAAPPSPLKPTKASPRLKYAYGKGFGQSVTDRYGKTFTEHGQDINVPAHTQLNTSVDGTIVFAGNEGQLGNHVIVKGTDGIFYWYGHLAQINVTVGQKIDAGTPLGLSGGGEDDPGRGNATGAHLWFATSKTRSLKTAFDPRPHVSNIMFGAEGQSTAFVSYGSGAGDTLAPNASDADVTKWIHANYPGMDSWLAIPELRDVMFKAARGEWDTSRVQEAVRATPWWKSNPERERAWQLLIREDRATATQTVEQGAEGLKQIAEERFLFPLSDDVAKRWATSLVRGKYTQEKFEEFLRGQAAGMRPAFSEQILAGADPTTVMEGYRQMASQELERPVDYHDITLKSVGVVPMTYTEYRDYLRGLPEWRRTQGAQNQAAQFLAQIGQTMGVA